MKKRTISLSILVIFGVIALTACGGVGLSTIGQAATQASPLSAPAQTLPTPAQGTAPSGASGDLLAAYQGTLENVYTAVSPSVVNIRVVQKVAASDSSMSQIPGFPFFN